MHRPCFLVVDREFPGSISTRKLVIETAKFNVLTAYSGGEALEAIRRFPNVDALVMDSAIDDIACPEMVRSIKAIAPKLPIILIQAPSGVRCDGADCYVASFDPAALLRTLAGLLPREADEVEKADEQADSERA